MTRVGVIGGSGFMGHQIVWALEARGAEVIAVRAPRLRTGSRELHSMTEDLKLGAALTAIDQLKVDLRGCAVVVNAAGVADATGGGDGLFGANALLPGVIAMAVPSSARLVHVSSAAVQGWRSVLDESTETEPFSPYSSAKALGEAMAVGLHESTILFRPTSVHGSGRGTTRMLVRIAASPVASVAGRGVNPTPQVLVENVADAVAFVALSSVAPPTVVLQPAGGLTTGEIIRLLGNQEPRHVPVSVARILVNILRQAGRLNFRFAGTARRLEMLWFGQAQEKGWLDGQWHPVCGNERWKELS